MGVSYLVNGWIPESKTNGLLVEDPWGLAKQWLHCLYLWAAGVSSRPSSKVFVLILREELLPKTLEGEV
jgi:hypothetical protein